MNTRSFTDNEQRVLVEALLSHKSYLMRNLAPNADVPDDVMTINDILRDGWVTS